MKTSRLQTERASDPKLPRNPTSTATTVCQYAVLLYVALNYILQDSPQHVKPSKKGKQSQYSASSTKLSQKPPTTSRDQSAEGPQHSTKSNKKTTTEQYLPKDPQAAAPSQPFSRPRRHRRESHQHGQHSPAKTHLQYPSLDISTAQMSAAWARIRAVSRVLGNHASMDNGENGGKKPAKRVRWGVVRTRHFEPEAEAHGQDIASQPTGQGQERARRDLQPSIETEGDRDYWEPTEGSDGQLE
jgi:hypothetical protein